jgi:hypothetical protein
MSRKKMIFLGPDGLPEKKQKTALFGGEEREVD